MKERNYGLDLLRIVSSWMVVVLHVINLGGILHNTLPFSAQYYMAWALNALCYCAIHCFALISGYVGIESTFKLRRIIDVWVQVVFYCLAITLFFQCVLKINVGLKGWIKAFMPVMFQQYWYVTAYFCLFFFMPALNCIVKNLNQKYMKATLFMMVVLFSILQTIRQVDVFGTGYGFSFLWLAILYVVGAYIKQYDVHMKPHKAFCGYVLCCLIAMILKTSIEFCPTLIKNALQGGTMLITYTSPLVLFAGIFLFLCFESIKNMTRKLISAIAPASFGVYIIHTHPMVLNNILKDAFLNFISCSGTELFLLVIGTSIGIWCLCIVIEKGRMWMFKKCNMKKLYITSEKVFVQIYKALKY